MPRPLHGLPCFSLGAFDILQHHLFNQGGVLLLRSDKGGMSAAGGAIDRARSTRGSNVISYRALRFRWPILLDLFAQQSNHSLPDTRIN